MESIRDIRAQNTYLRDHVDVQEMNKVIRVHIELLQIETRRRHAQMHRMNTLLKKMMLYQKQMHETSNESMRRLREQLLELRSSRRKKVAFFVCLYVYLSVCLSACLPACLLVCLS